MEFYFSNCKKIKALAPGLVLKNSLLFNVLTLSMMMIFTSSSTSMPFKGTGSQPWQFFVSNIPLYRSLIFCLMVYLFNLLLLQALNNAGNWILKQSWVVLIFDEIALKYQIHMNTLSWTPPHFAVKLQNMPILQKCVKLLIFKVRLRKMTRACVQYTHVGADMGLGLACVTCVGVRRMVKTQLGIDADTVKHRCRHS